MRFFLERGLPDQTFAELEAIVHAFAFAIGVAREKLELRLLRRTIHHIEYALLRGDDRRQLGQNEPADREQIFLPRACG